MIADFEDFRLWVYGIVDELWQRPPAAYKPASGPRPDCSDSELLTMALVGECRGWTEETVLLACWREHRDLFPVVPERSRFNRRRRALVHAINAIRQGVLAVQFGLAAHHAHTFWGLCARLYTKLAAHTLCLYLNRLLGHAALLQVKQLAFPN